MRNQSITRLAIFASGTGTNAEAILRYFEDDPNVIIALILSNNPNAGVLDRAVRFGVPAKVFNREQFRNSDVLGWLQEKAITHIVLAGFLWLIPGSILSAYPQRILNIHPALLPKFGGRGMYGSKVHEAVKAASETETGISIHEVNEHFDEGKILFQARCKVEPYDTPEEIAQRVHELEYKHFPRVIKEWVTKNKMNG